jgi:hypothetical protein
MNAPERNLHLKAPASGELARIVRVNEEIKAIVSTAFRINLMALNAIFLAKRAGNAALGFRACCPTNCVALPRSSPATWLPSGT